jgi:hypothetical protein
MRTGTTGSELNLHPLSQDDKLPLKGFESPPLVAPTALQSPLPLSRFSPNEKDTMLRQALGRSAWRAGRQATLASRTLSTTAQRNAEVELTIGEIIRSLQLNCALPVANYRL